MDSIPNNWKLSASEKGGLFTIIRTGSMAQSYEYVERIKSLILESRYIEHVSLTMNADFITVTLDNYEHEKQVPKEDFIKIAHEIDRLLVKI